LRFSEKTVAAPSQLLWENSSPPPKRETTDVVISKKVYAQTIYNPQATTSLAITLLLKTGTDLHRCAVLAWLARAVEKSECLLKIPSKYSVVLSSTSEQVRQVYHNKFAHRCVGS